MDSITFTLAGKDYAVTTPLTLGQAIDLRVAVALPDLPDPQENTRRSYMRSVQVIATALMAEHPEVTEETILNSRVTMEEIGDAVAKIFKISGLERKEQPKGEAPAPAEDPPGQQQAA